MAYTPNKINPVSAPTHGIGSKTPTSSLGTGIHGSTPSTVKPPKIVSINNQTPTQSRGPVAPLPGGGGPGAPGIPPHKGPGGPAKGLSYGLNVNDPTPYDPFATYPTVGALNKAAIAAAAPGYTPQLNQAAADKAAENAADKQRMLELTGIYKQYGNQAQQAFKETQQALNQMIGANATGDTQANGILQAALSSAAGGQGDLGTMMGVTGTPTAQDIAPYMSAAQAQNAGTGGELKTMAGGLLSTTGEGVANASLEGAQQKDIENTRHLAALQSNRQTRAAIIQGIPDLVQKAREQLISDSLNAQGLKFQETLANKQFGLAKTTEKQNAKAQDITLAINKMNSITNAKTAEAQIKQNQQTIDHNYQLALKNIAATNSKTAASLQLSLAKATGQRQANAVKYLTSWAAPTKQEISTTTKTLPDGTVIRAGQVDTSKFHRDAGAALKTLMTVYGLNLATALSYMSTLTIPIGGGQQGTVGQWAATYMQRLFNRTHSASGVTGTSAPPKIGGTSRAGKVTRIPPTPARSKLPPIAG